MAGGIQKGTEAGTAESKRLDSGLRKISEAIAQVIEQDNIPNAPYFERGHKNLVAPRFTKEKKNRAALPELSELGITVGCIPDGGMWFDGDRNKPDRKLLTVFEAKHQQDGGNAIERWCKNYMLSKGMNHDMTYHTIMSGQGAQPGGVLDKFAKSMKAAEGQKCVFHQRPAGFSDEEIFDIMKEALYLKDITFDRIRPCLETKLSRFLDLYEEMLTPEEIVAEMLVKQKLNSIDDHFVKMLEDNRNPMTQAWLRVSREDKSDAKELALDMLSEDFTPADVANAFEANFVLTIHPRLNT